MKMILTIGFDDYIVPDCVNAVKLYETLAKLRPCKDHSCMRENRVIIVAKEMVNLDLKSVPMHAKIVQAEPTRREKETVELKAAEEDIPFTP